MWSIPLNYCFRKLLSFVADKYRNIISFRVDRMLDVEMEDDPIAEHECISSFDLNEYKSIPYVWREQQSVTLLADNSMVNMVLDKLARTLNW